MKKFHFDLIILGKYFRQLNSFIDQSYHIPRKLANSCTGAQPSNRVKNDHLSVMRNFQEKGFGRACSRSDLLPESSTFFTLEGHRSGPFTLGHSEEPEK